MQISVHADMKSTIRRIFQQKKTPKNTAVVIKRVSDSICKRLHDTAMRENFNLKPER